MNALSDLLASKKFLASALASGVAGFLAQRGVELSTIGVVIAPLLAFVGAQGIADAGKERARVESSGPSTPGTS